jgi:hypothetical protein
MNLERLILQELQAVHPRMLTEKMLFAVVTDASLTEVRNAVRQLEAKCQVVVIKGEDSTRIKITTDGIARLSE